MEPKVTDELRVPNVALRRVREEERHESRSEFADALARVARKLGEPVTPSERYIARLEDGEVRYPNPAYRRVLMELCGRPISELGFTRQRRRNTGDDSEASLIAPGTSSSSSSAAPARGPLESWFSGTDLIMVSEWPVWFRTRLAHLI